MNKSFGKFLKESRENKKLTQKELAKILFVSESAVCKWEKDVAYPDITLLPKLSEILGVTEHELITASVDEKSREEKVQAKKWRTLSITWALFFYIAYAIALIPCFICDLAINKSLTWFWIVLAALILAFTFTNLPNIIKKHRLILLPLFMYLALCLLLGVCAIYTKGNWFFIPVVAVLLGLVMIFMPIYIAKYDIFSKVRKYNDFLSIAIDFVVLNLLLIIIDIYSVLNGFANAHWYFTIALPIVAVIYLILNMLMMVRFLKINRFFKTSIILFVIDVLLYTASLFRKENINAGLQEVLEDANIFKANLAIWHGEHMIERNVHLIVALSIFGMACIFAIVGVIRDCTKKRKNK